MFQCWRHVRQTLPIAQLVVAGSAKLYRHDAQVGPLGVAIPEFEQRHVDPLALEFGSLEKAGVHLVGLLSPIELRSLYHRSSLGVINLNTYSATESFSCSGVEMAACGLTVFSMASSALPETVGFTGDAVLVAQPAQLAQAFVDALNRPNDPMRVEAQRQQFRDRYRLGRFWIVGKSYWLHPRIGISIWPALGSNKKNFKYVVKKMLARIHAGWALDRLLELRSRLRKQGSIAAN